MYQMIPFFLYKLFTLRHQLLKFVLYTVVSNDKLVSMLYSLIDFFFNTRIFYQKPVYKKLEAGAPSKLRNFKY